MSARTFDGLAPVWLAFGVYRIGAMVQTVDPARTDFGLFYASARQWLLGLEPYAVANLNPPTFTMLVAPLTYVPLSVAFWIWTLLGALSVAATLRLVHRAYPISTINWFWILGCLMATQPALHGWEEGQVAWLLLYPITRAWLEKSSVWSGAWMGLAVAVKPPLALMALLLPGRFVAALVATWITLIAIGLCGLQPWLAWIAQNDRPLDFSHPSNLSLWGVVHRLAGTSRFSDVSAVIGVVPTICVMATWALALAVWVLAQRDRHQRWLSALLFAVLVQPLGWIYYLTLGLGPMWARWRASSFTVAMVVLLTLPWPYLGFSMTGPWRVVLLSGFAAATVLLITALVSRANRVKLVNHGHDEAGLGSPLNRTMEARPR